MIFAVIKLKEQKEEIAFVFGKKERIDRKR